MRSSPSFASMPAAAAWFLAWGGVLLLPPSVLLGRLGRSGTRNSLELVLDRDLSGNLAAHQEGPICLPVSLSGLHWAASNSCQDCPWSWLRPAKTISKDLNKDFGAQRLNGSYIKTYYEAR